MDRGNHSKNNHWPSKLAIAGIGAGVIAYDMLCPEGETISEGCDRIMESRIGKVALHALAWSIAAHVTNTVPERWDWVHHATKLKRLGNRAILPEV